MKYNIEDYLIYHQQRKKRERKEINNRHYEMSSLISVIKNKLIKNGAKRIILFGSFPENNISMNSDLDIAVEGIPDCQFFKVYSELCDVSKDVGIDLVDIDETKGFFRKRVLEGEIIYNG